MTTKMQILSFLRKSNLLQKSFSGSVLFSDKLIDRMLNINTISMPVNKINRNSRFSDSVIYNAYPYYKLWKCVNLLSPSNEDVVFDIGCGMGRMLCVFARRQVKKCIGIEISAELAERTRQNVGRLNKRKAPIEVIVADAAEADYSGGTIYCLFNPFGPKTLEVVLERIHQSVRKCPRQIKLVYFNAKFDNLMEDCGWLRCFRREESSLTRRYGVRSFWTNIKSKI